MSHKKAQENLPQKSTKGTKTEMKFCDLVSNLE